MTLEQANDILRHYGPKKDLHNVGEYYSALGFMNGIIEGLLLYAPEEIQRRVLKK